MGRRSQNGPTFTKGPSQAQVMAPVRWRWARNGAIIGGVIVLADFLLEWRGQNIFEPWRVTGVTANIEQILTKLTISAFIGFALGYARDLLRRTGR